MKISRALCAVASLACPILAAYPWSVVGSGLTIRDLEDVTAAPGGFVAVGYGTLMHGSVNSWVRATAPSDTAYYLAVAFQGAKGIAVGYQGAMAVSQDSGSTWATASFANLQGYSFLDVQAGSAGEFWIGADHGRVFRVSAGLDSLRMDSLATGLSVSRIVTSAQSVWALASNGKRFGRMANGAWADSGNVLGVNLGDSLHLDAAEHLPSGFWVSASYTNCSGVAGCVTTKSLVRRSSNGLTWADTLLATGAAAENLRIDAIGGSGDSLVLLAGNSGFLAEVRNGQPYSVITPPTTQRLLGVAFAGEEAVVVGGAGLVLSNAVDPSTTLRQNPTSAIATYQVRIGQRQFALHVRNTAPNGTVRLELVDSMGKVIPAMGVLSNGVLELALSARLQHQSLILRSRDRNLRFDPVALQ